MRIFAALVTLLRYSVIGVRMPSRGVTVRVIVRVVLAAVILMMPERHALPRGDGGHALDRYAQGQQQNSENPEKRSKHRPTLYAS
jgi:hypothetical protein